MGNATQFTGGNAEEMGLDERYGEWYSSHASNAPKINVGDWVVWLEGAAVSSVLSDKNFRLLWEVQDA